jgi:uncharacterized protein YaaW (UPF0174 family)
MGYAVDQTLFRVLGRASKEDLDPLRELLNEKSVDFQMDGRWALEKIREGIERELRLNGGHMFANIARGGGPPWGEIVRDVAEKLKVAFLVSDSTPDVELKVAAQVLQRAVDEMSPEQRSEFHENLKRAGLPTDDLWKQGAVAAAIVAGRMAGFAAYQGLVTVANAVARALLGHGLRFATSATLTKSLCVALGPIGWAVTGLWTILDAAGAAYRITVPAVVMVAVLRAQQQGADQASGS